MVADKAMLRKEQVLDNDWHLLRFDRLAENDVSYFGHESGHRWAPLVVLFFGHMRSFIWKIEVDNLVVN